MATYAASKAFDLQFTEALAEELRDEPVDVMALCPGATRTSFGERAGWRGGDLPCAADPNDVAADALESLGRQTVCVPGGGLRRAALSPMVAPRRLFTGASALPCGSSPVGIVQPPRLRQAGPRYIIGGIERGFA